MLQVLQETIQDVICGMRPGEISTCWISAAYAFAENGSAAFQVPGDAAVEAEVTVLEVLNRKVMLFL